DREAVRLVADPLQKLQGVRVARQHDRLPAPRHIDLLEPLGEAPDRAPLVDELAERGDAARQLPLAAVDHDQPRQRGEAGVPRGVVWRPGTLLDVLRHEATRDLADRGEVVLPPVQPPDLEAAVVRLLGRAALEYDHRGDGMRGT